MAEEDRRRWNEKHSSSHPARPPLPRLLRALTREDLKALPDATALDVACGSGRHALELARAGHAVLAVDVSDVGLRRLEAAAVAEGLDIRCERRDLEADGLPPGDFDLVVVTDYLDRRLFPALREAVAPGGSLFFETFTWREAEQGGLRRPYCLEPGELLAAFAGFEILAHEKGLLDGRFRESLLARRPRTPA